MKSLSIGLLLILFSMTFMLSSCDECISGNGQRTTKSIKVGEITRIRLSADAKVFLVSDSINEILIDAESNIIDAYEFEESGKVLKIRTSPCILGHEEVRITIPVRVLEGVTINGSGDIVSKERMRASDLELNVNGSGDIELEVEADNVVSKINGSGDINLTGSGKNQRIQVNGSGNVEAASFASSKVNLTINGSGDCRVMATSALHVVIRGSGNVYYKGSPDVTSEIRGSGSVEKLNE